MKITIWGECGEQFPNFSGYCGVDGVRNRIQGHIHLYKCVWHL